MGHGSRTKLIHRQGEVARSNWLCMIKSTKLLSSRHREGSDKGEGGGRPWQDDERLKSSLSKLEPNISRPRFEGNE